MIHNQADIDKVRQLQSLVLTYAGLTNVVQADKYAGRSISPKDQQRLSMALAAIAHAGHEVVEARKARTN